MRLLDYLKKKDITIETNLTSNDFILSVSSDKNEHLVCSNNGLSIIIITDDIGVLGIILPRNSLFLLVVIGFCLT